MNLSLIGKYLIFFKTSFLCLVSNLSFTGLLDLFGLGLDLSESSSGFGCFLGDSISWGEPTPESLLSVSDSFWFFASSISSWKAATSSSSKSVSSLKLSMSKWSISSILESFRESSEIVRISLKVASLSRCSSPLVSGPVDRPISSPDWYSILSILLCCRCPSTWSSPGNSSTSISESSRKSSPCNLLGRSSNNVQSISVSSPLIEIDFCLLLILHTSGSVIDFLLLVFSFSGRIGVEASSGELSEIPESLREQSISL